MAIHGSIEEAGLPDVLQLLTLGRKTGCLAVLDGEMHGEIYLDAGRISYATISNRTDRLGDILLKSGRITRDQLQGAVAEQKRNSKKQLGRVLLDSGAIERAELERVVRLQVSEAVYFLFTLKHGAFTFNADRRPPHQFLSETLDAEGLLLEGARRVDEWSLIQKKIPSFDLVYRRGRETHAVSAADLTDEQRRILPLLDGTRDVAGVLDATGMSEFDVGKALYGLVMAGFAQLVERRTHVRHLDYRELLAWVVREAEFADPQRRKDAGRHIVDCPTCAERLRTIQVRRTEGSGVMVATAVAGDTPTETRAARASAPRVAARVAEQQPLARPAAAAVQPAAEPAAVRRSPVAPPVAVRQSPVAPPVAARQSPPAMKAVPSPAPPAPAPYFDRRSPDRRAGADRREFERRAGLDRRCVASSSWGLYHEDRRRGPRREDDRRPGHAGGRRASDRERFGGMVASAAPPVHPAGPGERNTGPRRLVGLELREGDWKASFSSVRAPAAEPEVEPSLGAQVSALAGLDAREAPPAEVAAAAVSASVAPPASHAAPSDSLAAPPASSRSAGAPKGEIEWLVSPEESTEMLRASRTQRRAREASLGGSPSAPPEPPLRSVRQPPAPVAVAAPPSGTPVIPMHPSGSSPFSPSASRVASVPPEPPRAAPALGHLSWGDDVPQPRITWSGAARPAERRALPVRRLAILAAVVCVGVLGYQAGRVVRHAPAGDAAQTVAAAPAAAETHAAAPPPAVRTPAVLGNAETPAPAPVRQQPAPMPAPVRSAAQPGRGAVPPAIVVPRPTNVGVPAQPPAAPAAQPVAVPAPQPAPTVGVLRGVVRDASGAPVSRARVSVRGTALTAVTDASGAYEIRDVPDGAAAVQAAADGFVTATADTRARAGATVATDLALTRAPSAAEPDRELADGGWGRVDRAEALTILGGTLGAIEGLSIESISKSMAATRQRVRVVQLTDAGQRIVLTETRAGALVSGGAGLARVTALRVMPPSEAYPSTTGTASFGNLLITVKSSIAPDALRSLLERLTEVR